MRRAIDGLIKEPQNNFRLCKNGEMIRLNDKTEQSKIDSIVADIFKDQASAKLYESFYDRVLNYIK